ncbi:MAG: ATP phosphoribosyltransferase regulatory subunit [Candidatus Pacebacteria bacterium]|nr:ATP phosphoribosyltransferase regulatory subunit [Candidatus Paceibacterota bacterium]
MISIAHTSQKTTDQALVCAATVAEQYGFLPIESVMPEYGSQSRSKTIPQTTYVNPFENELAKIMQSYVDHGHADLKEPTLIYQHGAFSGGKKKNAGNVLFGLHAIGLSHSIAEALLVKTALATLEELGITEYRVHVNSIGDRDSAARFTKELTNFLRKHINDIPANIRQTMKQDVSYAYDQLLKKQHELCSRAPTTVEFLTEPSRQHLREVLEYLEVAQVEYELNPSLIGHHDCYSKTLFEIRAPGNSADEEIVVYARGGRYDELSQRAFHEKVPAAGIIFEYEKRGRLTKTLQKKKEQKPKFYFIQLGFESRLRSLAIIETLRKARVPVYQTLGKDQLSAQLELARVLGIPYCVIMGQKEALERSVIVRNMDTCSQQIVAVDELPRYLKSL